MRGAMTVRKLSALMSGVLIKTGIYGVLRVTGLLATPPLWWGLALLALGAVSAVLGVAFALAQHDLKRLLAYHSIENVGIIFMGIGVALIGQATGNAALALLGMGGALLHVVNHALFFSDLALRAEGASILPDYDVVVFDEAHTMEAVAGAASAPRLTGAPLPGMPAARPATAT